MAAAGPARYTCQAWLAAPSGLQLEVVHSEVLRALKLWPLHCPFIRFRIIVLVSCS